MAYSWSFNFIWLVLLFCIPILLFLILFVLYQNFYAKDSKKPRLIILYSKTMIWAFSFLLIIVWAKIGDDMIDMRQTNQFEKLNQATYSYVDIYWCNQKLWNYDYQWWDSNLTKEQIEECRIEEKDRQEQYSVINKNLIIYKSIYSLSFVALLLLIHIGIFVVSNRKKD